MRVCACVCLCPQSCLTLCNPMDCSPPVSTVHGIFQARILEWGLPFPPPQDLPNAGIKPVSLPSPALQADSLPQSHLGRGGFRANKKGLELDPLPRYLSSLNFSLELLLSGKLFSFSTFHILKIMLYANIDEDGTYCFTFLGANHYTCLFGFIVLVWHHQINPEN